VKPILLSPHIIEIFEKRNDGSANTHCFVTSPELATALSFSGRLDFNPLTDTLKTPSGKDFKFKPPYGQQLPAKNFDPGENTFQVPPEDGSKVELKMNPKSERLQFLAPFNTWNGKNITGARVLIKAKGKCTTDHISMAGSWLRYRGHLDNISNNLLIGATNAENGKMNAVKNPETKQEMKVPDLAREYKAKNIPWIVIGDENYGEGSSREHAALEPRHLGGVAIVVRSFARIHETNLKKQGMLPLTFADPKDYDRISGDDTVDIMIKDKFAAGEPVLMRVHKTNGETFDVQLQHSFNEGQIEWFKAGSALNLMAAKFKKQGV